MASTTLLETLSTVLHGIQQKEGMPSNGTSDHSLGCAAARVEPARRAQTPLPEDRHPALAAGATPSDAGAGRSPGAELATAAGRRRRERSRAGLAAKVRRGRRRGGMRQCRAAGLAGLVAVLLGARCCLRRGWGCGGPGPRSPLSVLVVCDLVRHSLCSA